MERCAVCMWIINLSNNADNKVSDAREASYVRELFVKNNLDLKYDIIGCCIIFAFTNILSLILGYSIFGM